MFSYARNATIKHAQTRNWTFTWPWFELKPYYLKSCAYKNTGEITITIVYGLHTEMAGGDACLFMSSAKLPKFDHQVQDVRSQDLLNVKTVRHNLTLPKYWLCVISIWLMPACPFISGSFKAPTQNEWFW